MDQLFFYPIFCCATAVHNTYKETILTAMSTRSSKNLVKLNKMEKTMMEITRALEVQGFWNYTNIATLLLGDWDIFILPEICYCGKIDYCSLVQQGLCGNLPHQTLWECYSNNAFRKTLDFVSMLCFTFALRILSLCSYSFLRFLWVRETCTLNFNLPLFLEPFKKCVGVVVGVLI